MPARSIHDVLADPRHGRFAASLCLALLAWIALVMRQTLAFDGVLDTDVMSFGLAAFHFDVLAHQPHPPGYPGYVILLELVHALMPGLGPIEVARTGTRICGVLVVLAAYWTCRGLLALEQPARPAGQAVRLSLMAAALATVHPLLWFYGGDGQSHGAEALLVLLLLGASARVHRRPDRVRLLLLVAAFGLSGAVRPTIPLLSSPVLLWVFWRRPWRDWVLALIMGVAAVSAWYAPLVVHSGGWDLYQRASRALIGDLFVANYSVFGARATIDTVLSNMRVTACSAALALLPVLAISRPHHAPLHRVPWIRAAAAVIAVSAGFYALMFLSEPGYVTGLAALACLVPATWPAAGSAADLPGPSRGLRWRARLVPALALAFIALGPARLPLSGDPGMFAPTYAHVASTAQIQELYRETMCGAARGQPALVLTDDPNPMYARWLPLVCPDMTSALYLGRMPLRPMDGWLVYTARAMHPVPPPVPLEPGPPATFTVAPATRVLLAPDSDPAFARAVERIASCAPTRHASGHVGDALTVPVWPARCIPVIAIGKHVLRVPPAPDQGADTGDAP